MEHAATGPGEKWNRRKIGACSPFHKCQVTQAPQSPLDGKSAPQVSREKLRPTLCAVRSKVQQRLCGYQVRTVGEQGPSKPCAMEHEAAGLGEKWNTKQRAVKYKQTGGSVYFRAALRAPIYSCLPLFGAQLKRRVVLSSSH